MSTADAFCVTKGRGCQEQVAKSKPKQRFGRPFWRSTAPAGRRDAHDHLECAAIVTARPRAVDDEPLRAGRGDDGGEGCLREGGEVPLPQVERPKDGPTHHFRTVARGRDISPPAIQCKPLWMLHGTLGSKPNQLDRFRRLADLSRPRPWTRTPVLPEAILVGTLSAPKPAFPSRPVTALVRGLRYRFIASGADRSNCSGRAECGYGEDAEDRAEAPRDRAARRQQASQRCCRNDPFPASS
jgi:hypothetical protein